MINLMAFGAVCVPLAVFGLLFWKVMKEPKTDWKLATCLSGMAVATSLVFLLGSEKVSFLRYGEAMLQVNQKAEETRKLTEQNKRLAIMTAKTIVSGLSGVLASESYDNARFEKSLEDLLKEAGASGSEIDRIIGRTNSSPAKP